MRLQRLPKRLNPACKSILRHILQKRFQIAVVLRKRKHQTIHFCFLQGFLQQRGGLGLFGHHRVGGGRLDAQIQRNQTVTESGGSLQQLFTSAYNLRPRLLGQIDLIFNQQNHRTPGRKKVYALQPMQAERLRYRFFLPKQRIIVGTAGIPKAYPRGIVLLLQQLIAPQRRITGGVP